MTKTLVLAVAALASIAHHARGDAAADPCACSMAKPGFLRRAALTGDWGGGRTWLEDHGVTLGASYAGEVFVAPGRAHGTAAAGLAGVAIELALDKLIARGLGSAHVVGFGIHGDGLSARLEDVFGVSNNVATDEVRLFEAWVEQPIGPGAVRAGLLAADQEFVIARHSSVLIDATFGVIAQISTNLLGPVYPVATPGISARAEHGPIAVRAAIYDGDQVNAHGVPTDLGHSALGLAEMELWSTVKLGAWLHSARPDGGYVVVDHGLGGRLGAFARLGISPQGPIEIYADAGVRGPPGRFRPSDFCGLGVAYSRTVEGGVHQHHAVVEATYQLAIAGWLTIQPDAQLVITPGQTALVGAVRTTIAF